MLGIFFYDIDAAVCRTAVNDDVFEIAGCLCNDALNCFSQVVAVIVVYCNNR